MASPEVNANARSLAGLPRNLQQADIANCGKLPASRHALPPAVGVNLRTIGVAIRAHRSGEGGPRSAFTGVEHTRHRQDLSRIDCHAGRDTESDRPPVDAATSPERCSSPVIIDQALYVISLAGLICVATSAIYLTATRARPIWHGADRGDPRPALRAAAVNIPLGFAIDIVVKMLAEWTHSPTHTAAVSQSSAPTTTVLVLIEVLRAFSYLAVAVGGVAAAVAIAATLNWLNRSACEQDSCAYTNADSLKDRWRIWHAERQLTTRIITLAKAGDPLWDGTVQRWPQRGLHAWATCYIVNPLPTHIDDLVHGLAGDPRIADIGLEPISGRRASLPVLHVQWDPAGIDTARES